MTLGEIKTKLDGRVFILGIGNILRGDDAIGSLLAASLKDKIDAEVIDVQTAPENFLGKIERYDPDTLIIIDAVDFGGAPGEIKVFHPHDILTTNLFSTHNSSIALVVNFLKNYLKSEILFLAIQPKSIDFKEGLSKELEFTKKRLERFFLDNLRGG